MSRFPYPPNFIPTFRPRHPGPPPFRPFFPRPPIPGGFGPLAYRGRGLRPGPTGGFHNQTYTRNYDADASYVDPYTEVGSANFTGTDNTNDYTESECTNLKSTETENVTVIDYGHGAMSDVEEYKPDYGHVAVSDVEEFKPDYGHGTMSDIEEYRSQNTRVYGRARGYGVSRVHRSRAHLHAQRGRGVSQTNLQAHNYEETRRADNSYEETATLSNEQSVFPANRGRVMLQYPPSPRESHSNDISQNKSRFVKHQSAAVAVSSPAIIKQSPSEQQSQLSSEQQSQLSSEQQSQLSSDHRTSSSSMVPSTQTCIVQCPSKSTQRGPTVAMSGTVRHHLPVSQPQVTSNINVSRPQQGTSDTTSKNLSVNNSNSETVNTCMSKSTVSSSSKDNYNIQATSSGSNLTSGTSQNELTSLSTQSLTTNAKTSTATIKEEPYEMPHTYRPPAISQLSNCGPMNSATSQEKVDNPEDEEEESDEEVDTGYCQFCKVTFTNPDSYWRHTRGMLHTQRLMEAEAIKQEEGDKLFETEHVDAGPQFIERNYKGMKILSVEEQQLSIRHELNFPRITKERSDEEVQEYDFNKSNWMDVDVKVPAKDRDLNPEDVGREQFPDEFYCALCDVRCTGAVTFKMHVEGSKHKQKVNGGKKSYTPPANFKAVPSDRPAKLVKSLNSITEPVIGLQYITEFQKKDEKIAPKYVCNLCEAKCDGNSILSHVVGIKHKIHYFKEHYPETHHKMQSYTSRKKSEQNGFAEEFARDIELREGRQDVKVKMEIDICTEQAAADLIKSGALDHLLEGTGLTKEKLQKLDVESLKPTERESAGEKVKIPPLCKPVEERLSLLPGKLDADRLLPRKREDDRLLSANRKDDSLFPGKPEDNRLLPGKREDDRLLPVKREDDRLLTGRRPEDRLYPMYYPDSRLLDDRIPQRGTDDYFRGRALERDRYNEDMERMRRRRLHEIVPDDPYYSRIDPHYRSPQYPDPYYPPSRVVEDVQIKPVIIMDYGHSKKPVEKISTSLTEEERSFMKRKTDGPKTDEELFLQFLKWKKSKTDTTDTDTKDQQEATLTSDNYQSETTASIIPTQPIGLPSCTTSDQSTKKPENKNVNPVAMTTPNPVEVPPQVQELMSTLSNSMIHTEDEAAMALQVSNALTQALLQYQLKTISKELKDTCQQKQQNVSAVQQQQPTENIEADDDTVNLPTVPGLDLLKQSNDISNDASDTKKPEFTYSDLEKVYKQYYTSNDKKHKTFNYLSNTKQEQSLSISSDRDNIDDSNLCHTMHDERLLYKTQGDKALYSQGNDENTPVSGAPLSQHMDNYSLPKELQDTHKEFSRYIDSSYRDRYDYDTRHEPYPTIAGDRSTHDRIRYGTDYVRYDRDMLVTERDPYSMNRDRYDPITGQYYDNPRYDKDGRTIGDHYERQTTQIDLHTNIVCDYKHKPEKYEKIPAAYREKETSSGDISHRSRSTSRHRSASSSRNSSHSSSSSSSSSRSSSSSSSSSNSKTTVQEAQRIINKNMYSDRNKGRSPSKTEDRLYDRIRSLDRCRSREHNRDKYRNRNTERRSGSRNRSRSNERRSGSGNRHRNNERRSGSINRRRSNERRSGSRNRHRSKERRSGSRNRRRSNELRSGSRNRHRSKERRSGSKNRRRSDEHRSGSRNRYRSKERRSGGRNRNRNRSQSPDGFHSQESHTSSLLSRDKVESSKTLSSGKKDAFDIVALMKQSETESQSNPRDMVDMNSTSTLSKSKPTIKKISMTLKRPDNKTINRDEKVAEMFTADNSDDDSINEKETANTESVPHIKYNMPMPKDLDKAIYSNISLTHKY